VTPAQRGECSPSGSSKWPASPDNQNGLEAGGARTFAVTFFEDFEAKTKREESLSLDELADLVRVTTAATKDALPWLKFARFGVMPNPKTSSSSLRWNGNVLRLSGAIGDYDGGEMPPDEAAERLDKAGVTGLVYTSPSHMLNGHGPRWRVTCPFAHELPPDQHYRMLARLNGLLGGALAPESFTLSQAYYYGSVNGNPAHLAIVVDGTQCLDQADELDEIAIGKPNGENKPHSSGEPEAPIEDIRAALAGIPNPVPSWGPNASWVEWNNFGMAVWRASGGSHEGFEEFDKWSQQSPKYDSEETLFRWRHYFDSPPDKLGFGTLVYLARLSRPGWKPPSRNTPSDAHAQFEATLVTLVARNDVRATVDLFNTRYAVVNENGSAVVYERVLDPLRDRLVLVRIRFEDLKKLYLNRRITIQINTTGRGGRPETKDITKSVAEWWLADEMRRQYIAGVVFDPINQAPSTYWNLWSGFTVNPQPGDWSLMEEHIRRVICSRNQADADYLLNYIARMFQQPQLPGEVAIVLHGPRGAGKGILLNWLWRAWGQHGAHITNARHLVGNFNAHLRDCVMLFADEAFYAGDRQHEGVLKALITEPSLPIEGKYKDLVEVDNMLHIFMSSNADWVIPAAIDERRFSVRDVADNHVGDRAYFRNIADQMEGGGLAAMIWDMQRRDISGFEVRDIPDNPALKMQKTLSLNSLERWWLAALARGFLCKSKHGAPWFQEWHDFYTTELLWRSYVQWCDYEGRPFDRKTREQLGQFLTRLYPSSRPSRAHPVYEIDSIDRQARDVITDGAGSVETIPKALDEIAIVYLPDQHGFRVAELETARDRFSQIYDIVTPWTEDIVDLDAPG
jgi:hypothetical protein